jgi:hypothetical protein
MCLQGGFAGFFICLAHLLYAFGPGSSIRIKPSLRNRPIVNNSNAQTHLLLARDAVMIWPHFPAVIAAIVTVIITAYDAEFILTTKI